MNSCKGYFLFVTEFCKMCVFRTSIKYLGFIYEKMIDDLENICIKKKKHTRTDKYYNFMYFPSPPFEKECSMKLVTKMLLMVLNRYFCIIIHTHALQSSHGYYCSLRSFRLQYHSCHFTHSPMVVKT